MPKALVLGSGFVAEPCIDYLLRRPENEVTVACRGVEKAQALTAGKANTTAIALDVQDADALLKAVSEHDVVISLIPYTYHPLVIEAAVKAKKHFVSTSYVSPTMQGFDDRAKEAGITVMNEIGVDPGIDHLYAMKTIDETHKAGGKVLSFLSYCGGLPAPEASNNPLGYKLSWSGRGVLLAAKNPAKYWEDGKVIEIASENLLSEGPKEIPIYPAFAFEGYPNRDSTPYKERYGIPEAQTILRGTLRYKGNPSFVKALADAGFMNDDDQDYLAADAADLKWCELTAKVVGAASANADAVAEAFVKKANLEESPERKRIVAGIRWLGLLSDDTVKRDRSILDTLAALLGDKLKYEDGERDMIMLQHRFVIERADGKTEVRTSTMNEYGIPNGATAMARTVGIPCGIAVQLVLDGKISKKGVLAPLSADLYEPLIAELEKEGLGCKEEVVDVY
eukprot:m.477223 g.477223  ORF g.477223 m.477223 type:complete len:452 (-) comp20778_c0_seq1:139-1494(-)